MTPQQMTDRAALQGVRVLDLSQGIAGPLAARLLGDFGADVIKIEPPSGDPARSWAPLVEEGPEAERSLLFAYLNWNKRGMTLDLGSEADRRALEALMRGSDIVIESSRPGALAALGLAPAQMRAWNRRLVVCSVTDFGQEGPYAGYIGSDLVHQAMSGIMQISGQADRPPLKHGLEQAYFCAGLNAAYATLAAHCAAERDGIGDHVDLSVQECLVSELVTCETYYSFMGAIQGRRLPVQDPFSGAPIQTRRGWLSFQSGGPMPTETFADLFHNEALRDPRFLSNRQRSQHVAEVRELVAASVVERDAKEIFIEGSRRRLLMGVVQTAPDLLACEQLAERGFFAEVGHPGGRSFRYPAELARLSATPTRIARRAPLLGEHNGQLQDELAARAQPPAGASATGPDSRPQARLPLEGLRVLDLATVIAVPYMAALLSDLGAEVIKIESPHKLDPTRQGVLTTYLDNDSTGPDAINRSGMFQVVNRGKRSIVLDMAQAEGKQIFRRLVARSDIVVDNFTPRVMSGWGLGHAQLLEINPKLVCLSNTGYGSTGPWRNFPSQGTTLEPTMGISSYTGYRGDKPWKVGQSYPDFLACWTGLAALFAALHHVRATGEGQWIDLGMYQVGAALIPEALLGWQVDGSQPERIGNEHPAQVPSNAYPCAGDDRWLALSVETDAQWQALAALMAGDGLAVDPAWSGAAARREQRLEVDHAVAAWVRDQDGHALAARLQSAGIAAGPVLNNRDLLLDAHLRARGFHERVALPAPMGLRPIMGRPWKLAERPVRIRAPAPRFGADGAAILRELLQMEEQAVADLFARRVVCTEPSSPKPVDAMGLDELQRLRAIHEVDPDYRLKLGIAPA
jgi:crotonobetainyl-CoA:carnitine CoA-transferase CaiB-like acyl-CoA transferase